MIYKLSYLIFIAALVGFGPAAIFIRSRNIAQIIALSIPMGTVVWLILLVYSYYFGWSVNESLRATITIAGAISLLLYLARNKWSFTGESESNTLQRNEVYGLAIVSVFVLGFVLVPFCIAPANWAVIRTNPGDQNIYMMLADAVRQLSYKELTSLSNDDIVKILPFGLNLEPLKHLGPSAAIFIATISSLSSCSVLEASRVMQAHLAICTGLSSFVFAMRIGLNTFWATLASLAISTGYWAIYISDRSAYTQQLQQPITLLLLIVVLDTLLRLEKVNYVDKELKINKVLIDAQAIKINWLLIIFLVAATFIVYKELFIALIIPVGGTALLLYKWRNKTPFANIIWIVAVSVTAIAVIVSPTLKISSNILLSNLFTLKMDATWHLSWLNRNNYVMGYWGNSFFAEQLNILKHNLGTFVFLPVSVAVLVTCLHWCFRDLKNNTKPLLAIITLTTLTTGTFFLLQDDLYRCGKALGFSYFVPLLILALIGQEQFIRYYVVSATTQTRIVSLAIVFCVMSVFLTQLTFTFYYLYNASRGKELPPPYPYHSYLINEVKADSFNFKPITDFLAHSNDSDVYLDISNTYLSLWTYFDFNNKVSGVMHSIVDTDLKYLRSLPSDFKSNSRPKYVLAQNDYRVKGWIRHGAVVKAETDSIVLLELNSEKIINVILETKQNLHTCLTNANVISPLSNRMFRTLRISIINGDTNKALLNKYSVIYFTSTDENKKLPYIVAKYPNKNLLVNSNNIRFKANGLDLITNKYKEGDYTLWLGSEFNPKIRHNSIEIYADNEIEILKIGFTEPNRSPSSLLQFYHDGNLDLSTLYSCRQMTSNELLDVLGKPWFGESDLISFAGFAGAELSRWGKVRWTTEKKAYITLPGLDVKHARLKLSLVHTGVNDELATVYHNKVKIGECVLNKPGEVSQYNLDFIPDLSKNIIELHSSKFTRDNENTHFRALLIGNISVEPLLK